jgi:hypothetical protein
MTSDSLSKLYSLFNLPTDEIRRHVQTTQNITSAISDLFRYDLLRITNYQCRRIIDMVRSRWITQYRILGITTRFPPLVSLQPPCLVCVEQIRRLHPLAVHILLDTALHVASPCAEAHRHASFRSCTLIHATRQIFRHRQSHVAAVEVHLAARHERGAGVGGGNIVAAVVLGGVHVAVDYIAAGKGGGGG